MAASQDPGSAERADAAYLRLLLLLLVSAAFFDDYDGQIISLLLPQIKTAFDAGVATLGLIHVPIAAGQFVSLFGARMADRYGRRPVLIWSVVGFAAFTAASALSWSIWALAGFQFGAQSCIGAEFVVAVTVVVEEMPDHRRGRALGVLRTVGPLGTVAVGILIGVGLQASALGWRAFYLIGLAPLPAVAFWRRRLRETDRFSRLMAESGPGARAAIPLSAPWQKATRRDLTVIGMVAALQAIPIEAGIAWWSYYAEHERGFATGTVALFVVVAFGLGTSGYYVCGRAIERFGRKPTTMLYVGATVLFGAALFQVSGRALSFALLFLSVFFGLGIGPAISAFANELFPTRIRAQASAWVQSCFVAGGALLGPAAVGLLGSKGAAIGSVGNTVSLLGLVALVNLWLVGRLLPETRGRALDPPPVQA